MELSTKNLIPWLCLFSISYGFHLTTVNVKDYLGDYLKPYEKYVKDTSSNVVTTLNRFGSDNIMMIRHVHHSIVSMRSSVRNELYAELNATLFQTRRMEKNDAEHCYVTITAELGKIKEIAENGFADCENYYDTYTVPGSEFATEIKEKGKKLLIELSEILPKCKLYYYSMYETGNCIVGEVEIVKTHVEAFDRDYITVVTTRDVSFRYLLDKTLLCLKQHVVDAKASIAKTLEDVPSCGNGTVENSKEKINSEREESNNVKTYNIKTNVS